MDCRYTDEEIKNILERCSKSDCENCTRDWSYAAQWDCMRHIERLALDLINRQQTEIERLNKENDNLKNGFFQEHYKEIECQELLSVTEAWRKESLHNIELEAEIERLQTYHDDMESAIYQFREDQAKVKFLKDEIRAEAIKEFAERLKGEMLGRYCVHFNYELTNAIIDKLVKEMKEVDKWDYLRQ